MLPERAEGRTDVSPTSGRYILIIGITYITETTEKAGIQINRQSSCQGKVASQRPYGECGQTDSHHMALRRCWVPQAVMDQCLGLIFMTWRFLWLNPGKVRISTCRGRKESRTGNSFLQIHICCPVIFLRVASPSHLDPILSRFWFSGSWLASGRDIGLLADSSPAAWSTDFCTQNFHIGHDSVSPSGKTFLQQQRFGSYGKVQNIHTDGTIIGKIYM